MKLHVLHNDLLLNTKIKEDNKREEERGTRHVMSKSASHDSICTNTNISGTSDNVHSVRTLDSSSLPSLREYNEVSILVHCNAPHNLIRFRLSIIIQ